MGDFLQSGVDWLAGTLKTNVSQTVTYTQASTGSSVQVQATLGTSTLRVTDGTGKSRIVRTDRDFLIEVADLKINGVAIKPEDGDTIDLTVPGSPLVGKRYVVTPVAGEPSWRWCDPWQTRYRIHTKYAQDL